MYHHSLAAFCDFLSPYLLSVMCMVNSECRYHHFRAIYLQFRSSNYMHKGWTSVASVTQFIICPSIHKAVSMALAYSARANSILLNWQSKT
jgi:hypothetical protein